MDVLRKIFPELLQVPLGVVIVRVKVHRLECGQGKDAAQQDQKETEKAQFPEPQALAVVHEKQFEDWAAHTNREKQNGEPDDNRVGNGHCLPLEGGGGSQAAERPLVAFFFLARVITERIDQNRLQEKFRSEEH